MLRDQMNDVKSLTLSDVMMPFFTSDMCLRDGHWRVIGPSAVWCRSRWPMPKCVRRPGLGTRLLLVEYSDDDPAKRVSETPLDVDRPHLPDDCLAGTGYVELKVTRAIADLEAGLAAIN